MFCSSRRLLWRQTCIQLRLHVMIMVLAELITWLYMRQCLSFAGDSACDLAAWLFPLGLRCGWVHLGLVRLWVRARGLFLVRVFPINRRFNLAP